MTLHEQLAKIEKEIDVNFFTPKVGDGTPMGGGKGIYLAPKENLSFEEVRNFLRSSFRDAILAAFRETEVEEMKGNIGTRGNGFNEAVRLQVSKREEYLK